MYLSLHETVQKNSSQVVDWYVCILPKIQWFTKSLQSLHSFCPTYFTFWFIFYLIICNLFNDAVSSSDYIILIDGMISEWRIGRNMEGSGHGLI
jgi:hypothetical protein